MCNGGIVILASFLTELVENRVFCCMAVLPMDAPQWECMEETVQSKEVVVGNIFREVWHTRIMFER